MPNALNAFTLLEGTFGALWFAYVWVLIYAYHINQASVQHSVDAFNMLVWLPLYLGALYAAVGSFYTAPGALDSGRLEKQWAFHRIIRRPWIINSIALGTPLLLAACLIPCSVYSQRHLSRSYERYQDFSRVLIPTVTNRGSIPSAAQAQAFYAEAGEIWNDLVGGKRWLGIGYAIWTAFAALLLLFYIPAGGYMLKLVNAQAQTQHDMVHKIERQQREMLEAEQLQRAKEQQREANAGTTASARASRTRNASDPLLFQPLVVEDQDEEAGADGSEPSDCKNRTSSIALTASDSPLPALPELGASRGGAATTSSTRRQTAITESAGDGSSSGGGDIFFPPLRPAVRKREQYQLSNDAPPVTRWKYLRRCYRSLLILYVGIIAAATVYLVIAARLAVSIYGSFLIGPDEATYLVATSHQPTAWAAVFFGSLTLGAVFFRFADSPEGERVVTRRTQPSSSGGFARRTGPSPRLGDEAALPGGQVLSRSLPAVPESEGAIPTVSQQLLSQHGGGDDDGVDAARAHLAKMPSSPSMKFQLRKSQRRPDAIVILPVGSETNSYANQEDQTRSTRSMRGGGLDEQTTSKRSWRGLMGRYGSSSRALARGVPEDVTQGSLMTEEMGAASRPEFIMLDVPTLSESGAAQQDTAARDAGNAVRHPYAADAGKSSESFADPLLSPRLAQPGSPQVDGASIETIMPTQPASATYPRRSSSQRRIPVTGRYSQDEQHSAVSRQPSIPTRAPPADYYRGGDQLGRQVSPMGTAQPLISQSAGFYPSQASGWPATPGPSGQPASSSPSSSSPSLYPSVPRDMMYPPSSQVYAFAGASPSRATKRLPAQREPSSPTRTGATAAPPHLSPRSPSLASWRSRLSSSNGGELPRRPEAPNQPLPPSPADLALHRARLSGATATGGESPHEGSFRGWPYVKSGASQHLHDDGGVAAPASPAQAQGGRHAKKPSYDFF